ncbi:MAG: hypothetical protein JW774_08500, partial [Candidatus Aureabacteria bacterium]|nr:hypothetical protein [Candidatus Auribacterota bacterium]
ITTAGPMVGVRAMNMVDKLADYLSINADKFVAATPVAAPAQAAQAAAAQAADVRPEAFLEALRTMASILQPGTSLTNQLQELRRLSLAVGQLNTLRGALHNALQSAGRRSTAA